MLGYHTEKGLAQKYPSH